MPTFLEKLRGALYGLAIGDAMGAPVEGWSSERIVARFHSVETFLPHTHGDDPAAGKGNGRITDDTLMTEALVRAYLRAQDHLDAYGFSNCMIPEMAETKVWVPELQQEIAILDRIWWPEKYPWLRLTIANAEPRTAGIGNAVNCGVAMYFMPVGAVNAGDPVAAYQEAAALGAAHNESYAVEAAAVIAAAYAQAFTPGSTIQNVCVTAVQLAQDATRPAIAAALAACDSEAPLSEWILQTRAAIAPFDASTGHSADDAPLQPQGINDVRRPSRLHAIEELPVALAALQYGNGDFLKTIKAGVFYGRDCDSIASMAGALFGAIYGWEGLPENLTVASDFANRRNYGAMASDFHHCILEIFKKDRARFQSRQQALD